MTRQLQSSPSFPADVVDVECDAVPAVASIGSLGVSDNCDGAPSTSYDGEVRTDGDCPDSYTLERTWTSVDCAGNSHTQNPDHHGLGHASS